VLSEAFQVTFDCLTDVFGCFRAGSALGNASRQSRASCHKHSVLVWLQINAILHYSAFYQSRVAPVFYPSPWSNNPICSFGTSFTLRRTFSGLPTTPSTSNSDKAARGTKTRWFWKPGSGGMKLKP
jgi:hypothetical protein